MSCDKLVCVYHICICMYIYIYIYIYMYISSNINSVIGTVLNLFFTKRFHTHKKASKITKKHQKHQKNKKHKNITKQKHKNANKWTKINNALKKHLRRKKSLIRLFVFLCLQRKKIEKSLQWKCWFH